MFLSNRFELKLKRPSFRQFAQGCLLVILALSLGACNTALSVGAADSDQSSATATEPGLPDTPISPTPTSGEVEETSPPDQHTYTNEQYGFELTVPDNWTFVEKDHSVLLEQGSLRLRINYALATEEFSPELFGRTGISAGDFIYVGKLNFMGMVIPVDALVYEGKTKGIFYGQGKLIQAEDLILMIVLEKEGEDYSLIDIPEVKQAEAFSIVETFRRTDQAAQCLAQGGRWEVLGFSGPGCNLPTSDGGELCSDSQVCEGLCMADDEEIMVDKGNGIRVPDPERIDEMNARGEELHGVCSAWQSTFGCHVVVEKGKYAEICID